MPNPPFAPHSVFERKRVKTKEKSRFSHDQNWFGRATPDEAAVDVSLNIPPGQPPIGPARPISDVIAPNRRRK
jgi:hypothetical protein